MVTLSACGGGSEQDSTSDSTPKTIGGSTVDAVLVPADGQVVSQLIDAAVEGLPYRSTSGVGSTIEGRTNALGQFITYPGGSTSFQIGSVNLGNWYEPSTAAGAGGGTIVQLPWLSYGQSTCSSPDAVSTARILLGLNSLSTQYQLQIPSTALLNSCPIAGGTFFEQNGIFTTTEQATKHLQQTENRVDVQRKIAAALFGISLSDIDSAVIGANYSYNDYGANAEGETTCTGYANGHAGVDFQTKDVAGSSTADRDVYFLTDGTVLKTDAANGRVIVSANIAVNNVDESVKIGYLHLRSTSVVEGQTYKKGEKLGVQGNLGLGLKSSDTTTQEHVHVEIRSSSAPTGAACGASPKNKVGALDPLVYFTSIVGGASGKWRASWIRYGVSQSVEFESSLPQGAFTASGRETFVSGDCTLTSELKINGIRNSNSIDLRTETTTAYKACPDGVYTASPGFVRNYKMDVLPTSLNVTSVDQCDFTWHSPYGCFKFSTFKKI